MADQVKSKAQLLSDFSDNTTGLITPQTLRNFVVSNLSVEREGSVVPVTISSFTDLFVADPGCSGTTLPAVADFGDRSLVIINNAGSGHVITADGSDTIAGNATLVLEEQSVTSLAAIPGSNDWLIIFNTGDLTPPNEHALAYIEAGTNTTIISDATWSDINDTMTSGPSSADLVAGGTGILFNGAETKLFDVSVSIGTEKTAGGHSDYSFAIAINDTPVSPIVANEFDNKFVSTTLFNIITLNPGDTLKVQIRGDGNSDNVIVQHLNLRMTEIRQ